MRWLSQPLLGTFFFCAQIIARISNLAILDLPGKFEFETVKGASLLIGT
jgi:hypothetical protein